VRDTEQKHEKRSGVRIQKRTLLAERSGCDQRHNVLIAPAIFFWLTMFLQRSMETGPRAAWETEKKMESRGSPLSIPFPNSRQLDFAVARDGSSRGW
jgi:hypothetical protein